MAMGFLFQVIVVRRNYVHHQTFSSLLALVALFCLCSSCRGRRHRIPLAVTIPAAACAQPGELTLRVWDENWATVIQSATDAWVQDYCPGATVTVDQVPWGQYWDLLKTDASSGDLPDIFNMTQDQFYYYASNDALLDLQPYLDAAGIDSTVGARAKSIRIATATTTTFSPRRSTGIPSP